MSHMAPMDLQHYGRTSHGRHGICWGTFQKNRDSRAMVWVLLRA